MGAAIVYAPARAGLAVTVLETDPAAQARAAALQARFVCRTGYDDLPKDDLAIKAAFEDMDVKRQIFARLQAALPKDCILATNASYFDVNRLAEGKLSQTVP